MKSTSDLFNEMIPLGRLIQMVNQKDRLLNDYLLTHGYYRDPVSGALFHSLRGMYYPVELKTAFRRPGR